MVATLQINPIDGNDFVSAAQAASGITITGKSNGPLGYGDFAGMPISVVFNGKTYNSTIAANGTWSVMIPPADLALLTDGTNYIVSASVYPWRLLPGPTPTR